MVAAKVFVITIHFHIHNVYCRGARLRPWGPIRLVAVTSHCSATTRLLLPAFPLLVQEDLLFRQVVECGNDLRALDQHLKKDALKLQLVQGEGNLLLAQHTTSLARVLFPKSRLQGLREGVELELVMTPTSRFQSAAGPRVEVSTSFLIENCPEDKVKLIDLPGHCSCRCCQQDFQNGPVCKNHYWQTSNYYRYSNGPATTNWSGGAHQCDICEAYDLVVRRRFENEAARPCLRKYL